MVNLHEDAKRAYSKKASDLKVLVREFPPASPRKSSIDIHPSHVITPDQIIGEYKSKDRLVNGVGEETGRFWTSQGRRFGWEGDEHKAVKQLAEKIARNSAVANQVSLDFVLDKLFVWLQTTLEGANTEDAGTFIERACNEAIVEQEIWIPLTRTYSSEDFGIGDVVFRTITRERLDEWFSNRPIEDAHVEQQVRDYESKTRAKFQATLAACVKVTADRDYADVIALEKTLSASALLRFLAPANFTSKARSYALPIGMEGSESCHSFHLEGGQIKTLVSKSLEVGPSMWVVDEARNLLPNLLEALSNLAGDQSTPYRRSIYEAFQIYSRNNLTTEPSEKLVFVLVALEALLLKDGTEPIQSNLAERMAFLIGPTLKERKEIVTMVKAVYSLRSKFVHHGESISDVELLDKFLICAWTALVQVLDYRSRFSSRSELIAHLDDMKFS